MSERLTPVDKKEVLGQSFLSEINYYPIKSCAGISVDSAEVTPRGIKHDRELVIVAAFPYRSKAVGDFFTQRDLPQMALIAPEITDDALRIEAPGMPVFQTPLMKEGEVGSATVWRDTVDAIDQGDDAAKWLSEYLGVDVRLTRMPDDYVRRAGSYRARETDQVSFADSYPFLMISRESLEDLNRRLPQALPMNRFRPNIVIEGNGYAYGEDEMKRVQLGDVVFDVVKPCIRCVVTTTVQEEGIRATGDMKGEPLATLASYRTVQLGNDKGASFGQNMTHENTGRISVGDKIRVLATQPPPVFV